MPSEDIVIDRREPDVAAPSTAIVVGRAPEAAGTLDTITLAVSAAKSEPARRPLLALVASPRRLSGIGPASSDRRH